MLNLPDVTLCALGSTDIEGMRKSLDYSASKVKFGDVKLIEHECNGIDAWNKAIVFDLGGYISTSYALLIHPDGGVGNPLAWNPAWLDYDYIGSPWPLPDEGDNVSYRDKNGVIQRVGNSISLRSKKLMDLPKKLNMEWKSFHGFTNEDGYICVNMRHVFEENGCKFAPFEEAVKFGCEIFLPEHEDIIDPFVYHRHNNVINLQYPNFEKA